MDIPKIKKKITSFLLSEDGKITKQSVMTMGAILASVGALSIASDNAAASHLCTTTGTTGEGCNGTTSTTSTTTDCGGCSECFRDEIMVAVSHNGNNIIGKKISEFVNGEKILGVKFYGTRQKPELIESQIIKMYNIPPSHRRFVSIVCDNGTQIESTSSHLFIVGESNENVLLAAELAAGNELFVHANSGSNWLKIADKSFWDAHVPIYHLSTTTKNFLVSQDGVNYFLVHT